MLSQNPISFWISSVISFAYGSAYNTDCDAVRVKDRRVRKLKISFTFQEKLRSPASSESEYLVILVDLYIFLLGQNHPQAYGYLLHQSCGWQFSRSCNLMASGVVTLL